MVPWDAKVFSKVSREDLRVLTWELMAGWVDRQVSMAGINGSNGPDITVQDGIDGVPKLSEVVGFMGEADKESQGKVDRSHLQIWCG